MGIKRCARCWEEKDESLFFSRWEKRYGGKLRIGKYCRVCHNEIQREKRVKHYRGIERVDYKYQKRTVSRPIVGGTIQQWSGEDWDGWLSVKELQELDWVADLTPDAITKRLKSGQSLASPTYGADKKMNDTGVYDLPPGTERITNALVQMRKPEVGRVKIDGVWNG